MSYAITIYISDKGALSASVDADSTVAPGGDQMELQSADQVTQLVKAVQAEATGQETESPQEDQAEPAGIEPEQEEPGQNEDAAMQQGFQGVRGKGLGR